MSNIDVPQGSTLWSLLVLLYINDIVNCSIILKFILFANGITVSLEKWSSEIKKVIEWFYVNKLVINLSKFHPMSFTNSGGNPHLNLIVRNKFLEEKNVLTFLEVEVDSK